MAPIISEGSLSTLLQWNKGEITGFSAWNSLIASEVGAHIYADLLTYPWIMRTWERHYYCKSGV